MKKTIYIIITLFLIVIIGIVYTNMFIPVPFSGLDVVTYERQPDGSSKRVYCGGYQNPDEGVKTHLNNSLQRLLTVKIVFSKEDIERNKHIYTAYTIFALPISTVEVDCTNGSIKTVKGI